MRPDPVPTSWVGIWDCVGLASDAGTTSAIGRCEITREGSFRIAFTLFSWDADDLRGEPAEQETQLVFTAEGEWKRSARGGAEFGATRFCGSSLTAGPVILPMYFHDGLLVYSGPCLAFVFARRS